jgi:hypothetical protein
MAGGKMPWGAMMKWGGVYLVAVIVLSVAALLIGWVDQDSSELIGRAAGIGLVAVWGVIIAKHRRA